MTRLSGRGRLRRDRSSGAAEHARNLRRLAQERQDQDRQQTAALLRAWADGTPVRKPVTESGEPDDQL